MRKRAGWRPHMRSLYDSSLKKKRKKEVQMSNMRREGQDNSMHPELHGLLLIVAAVIYVLFRILPLNK